MTETLTAFEAKVSALMQFGGLAGHILEAVAITDPATFYVHASGNISDRQSYLTRQRQHTIAGELPLIEASDEEVKGAIKALIAVDLATFNDEDNVILTPAGNDFVQLLLQVLK